MLLAVLCQCLAQDRCPKKCLLKAAVKSWTVDQEGGLGPIARTPKCRASEGATLSFNPS